MSVRASLLASSADDGVVERTHAATLTAALFLRTGIVTEKDFRRIALSLPEVEEKSHFGNPDFRVAGKIFATLGLASEGYGVLLVSPEDQSGMVADAPEIFSPVPGGWGRKGSTRVRLAKVGPDILEGALRLAWKRKAPKRLLRI